MTSRILAASGLWLASALTAIAGDCNPTRVDLRGDWGQARFTVELADDYSERAVGLMNRASMANSVGMMFVYEQPQSVAFWMKDTLIPLDMIFIDATGTVTRVHENAVPLDLTSIPGGPDVLAVLEINGGMAQALGIGPGTLVRYSELDPSIAAWSCEE